MNFNIAQLFNQNIYNRSPNIDANVRQIDFSKSKPPQQINNIEEKDEGKFDVNGEISFDTIKLNNIDKHIGNLSIIAKELSENNVQGIDLVIVMDVSGSMSSVANDCIKILKHAVECLSSQDRLSIIVFDSDAKHLFPLQPMISSVKNDLKNKIDKCFTGGSTNLQSALELLIKVKEDGMINNRPFKVIILSDGQPDSGSEGFHLVEKIYEGEVKPEVFSCTFGGSVKADTLRRLLLPDNQHYYKHISNMEEFKSLITELGLDKNIVLGTNLLINFRGVKPLSDLAVKIGEPGEQKDDISNESYELKINQIKSGDIFSIPFEYIETFQIAGSYTDLRFNKVKMEIKEVEGLDSFVKNHYWYKSLSEMIKEVNSVVNKNEKLEKLNYIETLITQENLGDFFEDINDMMHKTRLMITSVDNNYQHYNSYTQQMTSISSHATPVVQTAYKTKTKTYTK